MKRDGDGMINDSGGLFSFDRIAVVFALRFGGWGLGFGMASIWSGHCTVFTI